MIRHTLSWSAAWDRPSHQGRWQHIVALAAIMVAGLLMPGASGQSKLRLETIRLPPGFEISVFAEGVMNARSLAVSPSGTVFVGSMRGSVSALIDGDRNGKADRVVTVASGLNTPNGVAFRDGALYVAEISRLLRYDDIERRLDAAGPPTVVDASFPTDRPHGWKFIRFGPDGLLYVPVGAPCNICEPDERYSALFRMKSSGGQRELYARGIRNTVGFDWHPQTKELWFTDNGADNLGDERPNDELNHAPRAGLHFGYPYCHQGDMPDPTFGPKRPCSAFEPPAQRLGPHVAALGMRFYTGSAFPAEYRNAIIIAQHGSWNRTEQAGPIGYRVMAAFLDGNRVARYEPFATGWLQGSEPLGRPVDVEVLSDGSLLVSDDAADAIYRITYR